MNILNRYIWLVDTLLQAGPKGLTFEQINTKYRYNDYLSDGGEYHLRTFHNHRRDIEEIFGIKIRCNLSDYRYYIDDSDEIKGNSLFRRWLLQSVSVNNIVASNEKIRKQILLEDTPSSESLLTLWLNAIRDSRKVSFGYHSYWTGESVHLTGFATYAVKLYQRRWYVLGEPGEKPDEPDWTKRCKLYALDRIDHVELEEDTYELPEDYDPQEAFAGTYGLFIDQQRPIEIIRLKVNAMQANYMRSLPLHHSQEEVERTPEYSIFTLFVRQSPDLERDLMAHCDSIEVLAPLSLRERINERLTAAKSKYS